MKNERTLFLSLQSCTFRTNQLVAVDIEKRHATSVCPTRHVVGTHGTQKSDFHYNIFFRKAQLKNNTAPMCSRIREELKKMRPNRPKGALPHKLGTPGGSRFISFFLFSCKYRSPVKKSWGEGFHSFSIPRMQSPLAWLHQFHAGLLAPRRQAKIAASRPSRPKARFRAR